MKKRKKETKWIAILVTIIIIIAALFFWNTITGNIISDINQNQSESDADITEEYLVSLEAINGPGFLNEEATLDQQFTEQPPQISLSNFTSHNTPDDCWVTYNKQIYDISSYNQKNSENNLIPYCGSLIFGDIYKNQSPGTFLELEKNEYFLAELE